MQAKEMRWTKLALICVAALTAFFVAVHQVNGHMGPGGNAHQPA